MQALPKINICLLVAAVLFVIKDTAKILELHKLRPQNWTGQGILLLVRNKQKALNLISDSINLPDGIRLHVTVEGRKPS